MVIVVLLCFLMTLVVQGYERGHLLTHRCLIKNCQQCEYLQAVGKMMNHVKPKPLIAGEDGMLRRTVTQATPSQEWGDSLTAVDAKVRLDC